MTRYTPLYIQPGVYPASQDRQMLGSVWPGPASSGMACSVAGLVITIQPGVAAIPTANASGTTLGISDAVEQITLAAAPASNSRIDLICVLARGNDLDGGANNDLIFTSVTGTAAASPVAPATPAGYTLLYRATVTSAGVVTLTDVRPWALNPLLNGGISTAPTTAIVPLTLVGNAGGQTADMLTVLPGGQVTTGIKANGSFYFVGGDFGYQAFQAKVLNDSGYRLMITSDGIVTWAPGTSTAAVQMNYLSNVLNLLAMAATVTPLAITGAASQTADLFQIRDSTGTRHLWYDSNWTLNGNHPTTAALELKAQNGINLNDSGANYILGALNYTSWSDSVFSAQIRSNANVQFVGPAAGPLTRFGVVANGIVFYDGYNSNYATITPPGANDLVDIVATYPAKVPLVLKQAPSATADSFQIKSSAGTVLAGVTNVGNIYTSGTLTGTSVGGQAQSNDRLYFPAANYCSVPSFLMVGTSGTGASAQLTVLTAAAGNSGIAVKLQPSPTGDVFTGYNSGGSALMGINSSGQIYLGALQSFGGGTGPMMFLGNDTLDPSVNPSSGVILYSSGGVLMARTPAGGNTQLAPALGPIGGAGGDLAGSYPNPTVARINGTSVPLSPTAGQVLVATSGTAATWQAAPASPPNGAASNDLSGTYPGPTVARINGVSLTGTPGVNQVPVASSTTTAVWGNAPASPPNGAASGDLLGSYPGPTVRGINGTVLSALTTGILKNTTTTGVPSIAIAADIPVVGAGGTGPLNATDASTTNSRTPSGAATGDLSGTYPGPTVAKVNGITVTGTPATNQVLTATSTTAATWQAPAGASFPLTWTTAVAGTYAYQTQVTADTFYRFFINVAGLMYWGPGNTDRDVSLSRSGVGSLTIAPAVSATRAILNVSGGIYITEQTTSNVPLTLRASVSQTSHLMEFMNAAGTQVMSGFDSKGYLLGWAGGIFASTATTTPLTVSQVAGQSADLMQFLNSAGTTVLGGYDATGRLYLGTTPNFGGGTGPMLSLAQTTADPSGNPASGLVLYYSVSNGVLQTRLSTGQITTLAPNGSFTPLSTVSAGLTVTGVVGQSANLIEILNSSSARLASFDATGRLSLAANSSFGSGTGPMMFLGNDTADPSANPVGGVILFSSAGILKARDPSGAITQIAPAAAATLSWPLANTAATATTVQYQTQVTADTNYRFQITADGTHRWGPGNAGTDLSMNRTAAWQMTLNGELWIQHPLAAPGLASLQIIGATNQTGQTLIITGGSGATGNLMQVSNNAGTALFTFSSTGLSISTPAGANSSFTGSLTIQPAASTGIPLTIVGAASQTANLLNIQTSGGVLLARVDSAGVLRIPNNSVTGGVLAVGGGVNYNGDSIIHLYRGATETEDLRLAAAAGGPIGNNIYYADRISSSVPTIRDLMFRISSDGGTTWTNQLRLGGAGTSIFYAAASGDIIQVQNQAASSTFLGVNNGGSMYAAQPAAGNGILSCGVTGDANSRFLLVANGSMYWGPGNAATDTQLVRSSVGMLTLSPAGSASRAILGVSGGVFITEQVTTNIPLTVKVAASQSADAFEILSSTSSVLARFDGGGNLFSGNISTYGSITGTGASLPINSSIINLNGQTLISSNGQPASIGVTSPSLGGGSGPMLFLANDIVDPSGYPTGGTLIFTNSSAQLMAYTSDGNSTVLAPTFYNFIYNQTLTAPTTASSPYTVTHNLNSTNVMVELWDAVTLMNVQAQVRIVDVNRISVSVSANMPNNINVVVFGVPNAPVPVNPSNYANKAYVDARTPNLPAPVSSGTTIQSFTDVLGDVWIAKNGVRSGNWGRARDLLHTRVYRNSALPVTTTATNYLFDGTSRDVYGCYNVANANLYTCPVAGVYQYEASVCITFTAASQFMALAIPPLRTNFYSVGAFNQYGHIHHTQYQNANDTINLNINTSVALSAIVGGSDTWMCITYLGTG